MTIAAAWRPAKALVALTFLVPFSRLLLPAVGFEPLRLAEALVLAFLAGWLARAATEKSGLRAEPLALPMSLFACCVAVSAAVGLAVTASTVGFEPFARSLWTYLTKLYLLPSGQFPTLPAAGLLIEGIGLMTAFALLARAHPALTRLGMIAAAAAGLGVALFELRDYFLTPGTPIAGRIGAQVTDLNAAGSYFVLILPLVYVEARRRSRALTIAACAIVVFATFLTGSRSALALTLAMAVCPALAPRLLGPFTSRRSLIVAGVSTALLLGVAIIAASSLVNHSATVAVATTIRMEFIKTSLRMLATRPFFGIGVGKYYPSSWFYMSQRLLSEYPLENAHNNFLQIAAELGLVGIGLFLWIVVALVMRLIRTARNSPDRSSLLAVLLGLVGFLTTCVSGHPLLVPEVAFPFWILAGIGAALSAPAELRAPTARRGLLLVALVVLAISIPLRVSSEAREFDYASIRHGRLRLVANNGLLHIDGATTFFVPATADVVRFQLQALGNNPNIELAVLVDGQLNTRVPIAGQTPFLLSVVTPRRQSSAIHRIDLIVVCAGMKTDCSTPDEGVLVGDTPRY